MYKHSGETCIVIGNGPSLNGVPKELLDKYITFGSNKIYTLPHQPDYYCIIDKDMMANCLPTIKAGWRPKRRMFLRAECGIEDNYPIYPVTLDGFALDVDNFVVMGGTVTFAMLQIAFHMDFSTVLLVGVDHYYPKSFTGDPGLFEANGKDPDHFVPADGVPYFTPGEKYNRPEDTTTSYMIADNVYGQAGKKIINLTPKTKLHEFEKGTYEEW